VGAVRQAAYKRTVTAHGLEDWAEMVTGAARGTVTAWLAHRTMRELVPPPVIGPADDEPSGITAASPSHYRQVLHKHFQSAEVRKKFAEMGAEICWVSVGRVRPDPDVDPDQPPDDDPTGRDKIHAQLIDSWKRQHAARAQDELIEAVGYTAWLHETTQAQAQADLIVALTDHLAEARRGGLSLDDALVDGLLEHLTDVKFRQPGSGVEAYEALMRRLAQEQLTHEPPAVSGGPPPAVPPAGTVVVEARPTGATGRPRGEPAEEEPTSGTVEPPR
jgi:hypothetical protein